MIVYESIAFGLSVRAGLFKFFGGIKCVVCKSVLYELLCVFAVDSLPLTLSVGCVRVFLRRNLHYFSVLVHTFIGDDAAPFERFDNVCFRSRNESVGVRIFYSYDKITTVLFGIEVVVQCRSDSSHVERSGR